MPCCGSIFCHSTCGLSDLCAIVRGILSKKHLKWKLRQYSNLKSPTHGHGTLTQVSTTDDVHLSRIWGQYSPYFDAPSDISSDLPSTCRYTFGQILSRHGARYPTAFKSWSYQALIDRVKTDVLSFSGPYKFLENYSYQLGADELTAYGKEEMSLSGKSFYARYHDLTRNHLPFIRASGQDRVVMSAKMFSEGYHQANLADKTAPGKFPNPPVRVIISEEAGSNNTLSINTCPAFGTQPNADIGVNAKAAWAAIFVPSIRDRLNRDLVRANLTIGETIELMDLCPFESVANRDPSILSPFCSLFTTAEWRSYDYYQALDKYYGHSMGNPLAATLGVGFVNELIARLTNTPVKDSTCTNRTLDFSNSTFPLDAKLFADFSHDNDMEEIFAALGLYNATKTLPLSSLQDAEDSDGFSAAWTVPFAARMYVEKMRCGEADEEYVRVLVSNRVMPLHTCGADELGRCKLDKFIQSLSFARGGGLWDRCFIS
jgi:Histidine phosphatase superfamily (branch 2)